jgi:hypothetical protein
MWEGSILENNEQAGGLPVQGNQPVQNKQTNFSRKQIIGFIGAAVLAVGVFMPLLTAPYIGTINFFKNGSGDGIYILLIVAISVIIILARRYRWLYLTGIVSLLIIGINFLDFMSRISQLTTQLKDNMFGEWYSTSIQMQWGWAVLVIGALLLIVAAWIKDE